MRRSVRNGLAVAGMAGGMWFLGHAVANAADTVDPATTQSADAANNVGQDSSSTGSHSATGNTSSTDANAENKDVTAADTNAAGGGGGNNTTDVNTGAIPSQAMLDQAAALVPEGQSKMNDEHPPAPPTTITTGDATVNQQANGGSVDGSGNANVDKGAVNQSATAENNVKQTASSDSDKNHGHGVTGNQNESTANAENKDITKVDTNVSGGNGGNNTADVNTGLIGVIFNCPQGQCVYNITTGSVTVNQQANGGNVSNSGNVNIGPAGQAPCKCQPTPPCPQQVKPAVKKAAAVHPVVLSAAQPTGQLAVTGADYSAPLTIGLIALAAGTGLTLAGRRRATATV